ncbi:signal peptidase I [Chitinophaga deserti]|uniref:signal peptidase I n=1 Tax=Chitinophaga deserti TaxID=2164099 RepID=UPI000D6C7100|nr:signal peptidase I [Chitinophaga deserti]
MLIGVFFVARITKALEFYTVAVPSNYPTLKEGQLLVASKLSKPERGKFLLYNAVNPDNGEKGIWIFRIIGMPGDVLEIRAGDVYLNGQRAKDSAFAQYMFYIHKDLFTRLQLEDEITKEQVCYSPSDSAIVTLSLARLNELKISGTRYITAKGETLDEFEKVWKHRWNVDHFGQIKIPAGKYFVMGDNRHRALDSRFLGYVDEKDVVACVVGNY